MSLIKEVYRFVFYKNERRRFFREIRIRSLQNRLIKKEFNREAKNVIIFFVPGADLVTGKDNISGGVLSIASLYKETKELSSTHHAEIVMCTFPGQPLLMKHLNFQNDIIVYRTGLVLNYFHKLEKLIIHVPELFVENMLSSFDGRHKKILEKIPQVHINILNQNVRLMPKPGYIQDLKRVADNVTITTAHNKYCTTELRTFYGVPLHHYSTFASPENYKFSAYKEKANLLLLSPDDPQKNEEVQSLLKEEMPELEVRVIKNLKYEDYKNLISRAKWSITFGEGLDFYFIEPVFSGAISLAIYNELFFTPSFKDLRTVYKNYSELLDGLPDLLRSLDQQATFQDQHQIEFDLCADLYSYQRYRNNIRKFYEGDYTFK